MVGVNSSVVRLLQELLACPAAVSGESRSSPIMKNRAGCFLGAKTREELRLWMAPAGFGSGCAGQIHGVGDTRSPRRLLLRPDWRPLPRADRHAPNRRAPASSRRR